MIGGFLAAWREVRLIVLGLGAAAGLGLAARKPWLTALAGMLLGGVAYFFRDPERAPATPSASDILSPADGRVMSIDWLEGAPDWEGPAWRISIFLSLFDVHVQRSPTAGLVQLCQYHPGGFVPAFKKEAETNESNLVMIYTAQGRLAVRQIAGILARRIVCWVQPDDVLSAGQRLGLIKFGSRVDLLMPPEVEILATIDQRVQAGHSVLARWA